MQQPSPSNHRNLRSFRRDEEPWESAMLDRVFADVRDAMATLSGRAVLDLIESRIDSPFQLWDPVEPEHRELYVELCRTRAKDQVGRQAVRERLRDLVGPS